MLAVWAARDIVAIPGFTEPVSSLTHLVGAGVFAVFGCLLVYRGRGKLGRQVSLAIYAFSCVFLLSMSGVYHLLAFEGTPRAVLKRLDHGAIFLLIAGTFTPIHVILFRGLSRWGMLVLIWITAVAGITLKTVYFSDFKEWLGLLLYLAMGWLGTVSAYGLARRYGRRVIRPLLWGGLAYTIGAVLDFADQPVLVPGVFAAHEAFHVAILFGIGFHWAFIWAIAPGRIS